MARGNIQLVLCAAIGLLGGCMTADAADMLSDGADSEVDVDAVAQKRIALHAGAAVTPGEFDGYCEKGVGVYLSADETQATLTVYVLTPAEIATFVTPTLHLTTQDGDVQSIQVSEFETVSLEAGESRSFAAYAETTLMDVVADVSTL